MDSTYDFLYRLKPIREVEPGWWKLRWRPIRRGTWNLYGWRNPRECGIGITAGLTDWNNGWGRNWKQWRISVRFLYWGVAFWISWGIVVHKDGPLDQSPRRSLDIPTQGAK